MFAENKLLNNKINITKNKSDARFIYFDWCDLRSRWSLLKTYFEFESDKETVLIQVGNMIKLGNLRMYVFR